MTKPNVENAYGSVTVSEKMKLDLLALTTASIPHIKGDKKTGSLALLKGLFPQSAGVNIILEPKSFIKQTEDVDKIIVDQSKAKGLVAKKLKTSNGYIKKLISGKLSIKLHKDILLKYKLDTIMSLNTLILHLETTDKVELIDSLLLTLGELTNCKTIDELALSFTKLKTWFKEAKVPI